MKFVLLFVALFSGLYSYSQDTAAFTNTPIVIKDTVVFWNLPFEDFQVQTRFENKPYFIMFSASWCAPCQRIKREVFTNEQIVRLANQNYMAYYMDLENFDDMEINGRLFKVSELPTILFFDPLGKPIDKAVGFFDGYYFFKKLRAHIPPSRWGVDWIDR